MNKDHTHLVDEPLIAEALERHEAAVARIPTAAAELEQAREQAEEAKQAALHAAAGNGEDPLAAEVQHEDAQRRARVAERVHTAVQQTAITALDAVTAARGKAWQPVYIEGVRRRVAACRAGEAAKAALAAAETENSAAWAVMGEAVANGVQGVPYMHESHPGLRTEAEERHLWKANGLDPDTGKCDGWA